MNCVTMRKPFALALLFAVATATGQTFADNSDKGGKGGGKGGDKSSQADRRDGQRDSRQDDRDDSKQDRAGRSDGKKGYFDDRQRIVVRDYYVQQFRGAHCPPGLAKKNNGCMPPGQAKKWNLGRPLPREVIYYEVPQPLLAQIGPAPSGHRYVRVASDILLIALGTGMVIDAIQDLGRI